MTPFKKGDFVRIKETEQKSYIDAVAGLKGFIVDDQDNSPMLEVRFLGLTSGHSGTSDDVAETHDRQYVTVDDLEPAVPDAPAAIPAAPKINPPPTEAFKEGDVVVYDGKEFAAVSGKRGTVKDSDPVLGRAGHTLVSFGDVLDDWFLPTGDLVLFQKAARPEVPEVEVVLATVPDKTEAILRSRQGTHGSYADNARDSQSQKRFLRANPGWERLSDEMRETLDMNAHKTARILNGDPFVEDHWDDIAGYSRLASKAVKAELERRAEADKVKDGW